MPTAKQLLIAPESSFTLAPIPLTTARAAVATESVIRLDTECCRRCILDPHTGISLTLLQTPNSLLHFAFQTAGLGQHSVGSRVNNASVATAISPKPYRTALRDILEHLSPTKISVPHYPPKEWSWVRIPPGAPNSCFNLSLTVYETPQEARPVRAFLYLAVSPRLPLYLPFAYAVLHAG